MKLTIETEQGQTDGGSALVVMLKMVKWEEVEVLWLGGLLRRIGEGRRTKKE